MSIRIFEIDDDHSVIHSYEKKDGEMEESSHDSRQLLHDLHRLHTYRNHTQEQIKDIPRVVMLLGPGVRIVFDAAVLIVADGITFQNEISLF